MQFSLRQMLVLLLATAFVASVLTVGQNGARLLTTASIGILLSVSMLCRVLRQEYGWSERVLAQVLLLVAVGCVLLVAFELFR